MRCMYPAVLASLMLSTVALSETILVPLGEDIQSAINSASTGDVVQLEAGTYELSVQLDMAGKAITLRGAQGNGTSLTTIDSSGSIRAIQCVGGETADTVIEGISFQTSEASSGWAMVRIVSSSPTLRNCSFQSSNAGLVSSGEGSPVFESCIFMIGSMDGISLMGGQPSFDDCRFTSNASTSQAIVFESGSYAFHDCIFDDAGLYAYGDNASEDGCGSFSFTFSGCEFGGTYAFMRLAPYCPDVSSLVLDECVFSGIDGTMYSGVISTSMDDVIISDCVFTSNQGTILSPDGFNYSDVDLLLSGCVFSNNVGGINISSGRASIIDCTFTSNAPSNGSVVSLDGGPGGFSGPPQVLIEGCTFAGNSGSFGGAIDSNNVLLTVRGCDLTDNSASQSGGAISSSQKSFRLQDTRICGNTPDQISGGYLDLGGNCIETICVNCPDVPECSDSDGDGVCDEDDACPGEPDQDTDADGVVDCLDECPEDPAKVAFGRCGCGVVDTTILGDFDCDGDFDQDDYLAMGKALGEDGCAGESGCSGDLNNDGVVDGADLSIILSSWGVCDG